MSIYSILYTPGASVGVNYWGGQGKKQNVPLHFCCQKVDNLKIWAAKSHTKKKNQTKTKKGGIYNKLTVSFYIFITFNIHNKSNDT